MTTSLVGNKPTTGHFGRNADFRPVGSGPGGAPLACRRARAGFNTLLIEAGTDTSGYQDVQIPSFHPRASELPRQAWVRLNRSATEWVTRTYTILCSNTS